MAYLSTWWCRSDSSALAFCLLLFMLLSLNVFHVVFVRVSVSKRITIRLACAVDSDDFACFCLSGTMKQDSAFGENR